MPTASLSAHGSYVTKPACCTTWWASCEQPPSSRVNKHTWQGTRPASVARSSSAIATSAARLTGRCSPSGPGRLHPQVWRDRESASFRYRAVRVLKGKHTGKIAHDDEGDRAVAYFGDPIHSGYVLIKRYYLVNVTSLWEHERWKRAQPEFCRQMGIGWARLTTIFIADCRRCRG